jgi:hypothetical protein
MPTQGAIRRARADKRAGKSASTQAGEFVKDEIRSMKRGNKRIKSRKQAIAVGLSMARKQGVRVKPKGAKSRRPR